MSETEIIFEKFTRKPFDVEAVQLTEDNIDELARSLGEVKTKDGKTYIVLDRRVVPNSTRAYLGWWVTKLNDNLRCYSDKVFSAQFELSKKTKPLHISGVSTVSGWHPSQQTDIPYDVV
jgi:hypothetical protein